MAKIEATNVSQGTPVSVENTEAGVKPTPAQVESFFKKYGEKLDNAQFDAKSKDGIVSREDITAGQARKFLEKKDEFIADYLRTPEGAREFLQKETFKRGDGTTADYFAHRLPGAAPRPESPTKVTSDANPEKQTPVKASKGVQPTSDEVRAFFEQNRGKLDANKDGLITKKEIRTAVKQDLVDARNPVVTAALKGDPGFMARTRVGDRKVLAHKPEKASGDQGVTAQKSGKQSKPDDQKMMETARTFFANHKGIDTNKDGYFTRKEVLAAARNGDVDKNNPMVKAVQEGNAPFMKTMQNGPLAGRQVYGDGVTAAKRPEAEPKGYGAPAKADLTGLLKTIDPAKLAQITKDGYVTRREVFDASKDMPSGASNAALMRTLRNNPGQLMERATIDGAKVWAYELPSGERASGAQAKD